MNNSEKFNTELMKKVKNNFSSSVEINNCNLTSTIPFEANKLCKIENVVAIFIDMAGSTNISIQKHQKGASKIFKSYIESFITIFDSYGAKFIDIQGDGGFMLFDGKTKEQRNKALASAIHTVNFISQELAPFVENKTGIELDVRIGIDFGMIFAKKFGKRNSNGSDYKNEKVWLGKPVSVSSKLCNDKSLAGNNTVRVSDRFFNSLYKDYDNWLEKLDVLNKNYWEEKPDCCKDLNIPSIENAYILETSTCNSNSGFCSNNL